METENKKNKGVLFIFSAIPLLIYPGILIANIMSLAAPVEESDSFLLIMLIKLFLWSSSLYPIVYIICLIRFFKTNDERKRSLLIKIPYIYLLVCILLLLFWISTGG